MAELTPMMQKYMETKEQYKDCILFYRLGDFYEMFFDDAIVASKELEIALTGKSCGLEERAPMCGIPYHAVETYLARLVSRGYKVAICEQVEDPKLAKGLVKREVIRVVTPGTNLDVQSLEASKNNYLMCIAYTSDGIGISAADVTTGDYYVTEVEDLRKLKDELMKYEPSEIICNEAFLVSGYDVEDLKSRLHMSVSSLESHMFDDDGCRRILMRHFKVNTLIGLGVEEFPTGILAAGALLQYLYDTQKTDLEHFTHISPYLTSKYMLLDSSTRRNLELTETLREKQKRGSLLWVLDKTKTAMGGRLLRNYIEQPLIDKEEMEKRLDAIQELNQDSISRDEIREYLNPVYDLERLLSKVTYKTANPRDLIAFRNSLQMLPPIKTVLAGFQKEELAAIREEIDGLEDIYQLIDEAIVEEPPISIREGGMIKDQFDETIDHLRAAKHDGKQWLVQLEEEDRERTGIKNLKIKKNNVFGYFFEVTNSYKDLVPEDYIRKQTLSNCERFITQELKELESKVLGAQERMVQLEYQIFSDVRTRVADELYRVQRTAHAVARLDVLCSFAQTAVSYDYTRPVVDAGDRLEITDGRHPVVERMLEDAPFVPNDTALDCKDYRCAIITGPNMAGKSTYMRQVALITLMAQIGSFVPARSAQIGVVDSIFTRVGASDDLAAGQSTFMVEMSEVASILQNATAKSLILLDEIGRGTSTYDGMSIARAVLEFCADSKKLGAKTLFATHYHELTELENQVAGVKNYNIAVKKRGDEITFLRRIIRGGADGSYGVEVAKLAGVPVSVVKRARVILKALEGGSRSGAGPAEIPDAAELPEEEENPLLQISIAGNTSAEIMEQLKNIDVNTLTPIEALTMLHELVRKAKR